MTRNKLFNRLAKLRGKCYSFVNSSTASVLKPKLDTDIEYTSTDEDDDYDYTSEHRKKSSSLKSIDRLINLKTDDYVCTCCFEILLNPVSLLCGHNICMLCLANWFLISSKRICPTCRQEWIGYPRINLILKSTIEILFESQIRKRKANLDEKQTRETQEKFDKKCKDLMPVALANEQNRQQQQQQRQQPQQRNRFFNGIQNPSRFMKYLIFSFIIGALIGCALSASTFIGFFFMYVFNPIRFGSSKLFDKYYKPVHTWSTQETYEWLYFLGPWSASLVAPVSLNMSLNGSALLDLTNARLMTEPFNLHDSFYRHLLLDSISGLKFQFVSSVLDIWYFKNTFLFVPFDKFPRLTICYIYLFDSKLFNNLKLFFGNASQASTYSIPNEQVKQSINVPSIIDLILIPYICFQRLLMFSFYNTNRFTVLNLLVNLIIQTAIEISSVFMFFKAIKNGRLRAYLVKFKKSLFDSILYQLALFVVWYVLPSMIYNLVFIYYVYLKIFYNASVLMRNLKEFPFRQYRNLFH